MVEGLEDYLKSHPHKEGSFVLCNIAGLKWQMLKCGEVFSSHPFDDGDDNVLCNMIAINNNDKVEDNDMLKKKVVAIIRQNIHSSISAINKLADKAGYEDFNIEYDEIVEMLKLKSWELFENNEKK